MKLKIVGLAGIGLLIFLPIALVIGPLAVIWSMNTLFGLDIGYTFWTWLAALLLSACVHGSTSNSSRS